MDIQAPDNSTDYNMTLKAGSWTASNSDQLFQRCLVDSLREGVVMVDRHLKVIMWNRAAESMTGIRGTGMLNQRWLPSLIDLKDRFDKPIPDKLCPVTECVRRAEQIKLAATVTGQGGRQIAIDLQAVPVTGHDRTIHGAVVILHDLSSQLDLEQQVLTLYAHATRDQLTGVSNRAHFERSMEARIREFQSKGTTCSLIVADIDFFKKVNDDFGHHVGDHALMSFAKILQQHIRVHDLVARYGGEEFVIICPNCPVDIAVERAEEIRAAVAAQPIAALNGRCITASFGVTEFEPDDSAISAFVRADQALLVAKESGRNQVQKLQTVGLDSIAGDTDEAGEGESKGSWRKLSGRILRVIEGDTSAPMEVIVEKVKGYVSDNKAEIVFAEPEHVRIRIKKPVGVRLRRAFDRHTPFLIDLESQVQYCSETRRQKSTRMRISVRLVNNRDRRHKDLGRRIGLVLRDMVEHLGITCVVTENNVIG
jgi:diguanylate cyclase (GGDEF)-like protein